LPKVIWMQLGVRNDEAAKKAEAALAGGTIDEAVKALASELDPNDDVQATGATKRHLAGVLLRRVAKQLMEPRT